MNATQEAQFLRDLNQHAGMVHRICRSYFTDFDEQQDAFQEIVYQLWKSYEGFKGDSKFSTWMYKVALHTVFGQLRKGKNNIRVQPLTTSLTERIATDETALAQQEKLQSLYSAINTLTPVDKAITLLYLDDNSYDEIAAITGITKTNVSVRLVRIKKKLEEKLKNSFR